MQPLLLLFPPPHQFSEAGRWGAVKCHGAKSEWRDKVPLHPLHETLVVDEEKDRVMDEVRVRFCGAQTFRLVQHLGLRSRLWFEVHLEFGEKDCTMAAWAFSGKKAGFSLSGRD